jgi:hypothetical protein
MGQLPRFAVEHLGSRILLRPAGEVDRAVGREMEGAFGVAPGKSCAPAPTLGRQKIPAQPGNFCRSTVTTRQNLPGLTLSNRPITL